LVGGLVAAVLLVAAVAGPPDADGPPLDPASTGPDGTRALVDSLRALGADVDVTRQLPEPGPGPTSVLLLRDQLDGGGRAALLRWVEEGGTLVVADPTSPLTPPTTDGAPLGGLATVSRSRHCDVPALANVDRVAVRAPSLYEVPRGAVGCFRQDDAAFAVLTGRGEGTVVALASPAVLVNDALGRADHALLAVALLAPGPGARVTVLRPPRPGEGRDTLADLVSPRVWAALAQVAVGFLVLAAWRARRLGRPVAEPLPVPVEGSELVLAVGRLLQAGRGRARAAELLRADLARRLAARAHLPAGLPPAALADAVAARTGMPIDRLRDVLAGPAPADEAALVALAQRIESVYEEVVHVGP
jgi:hypothetical protein